MGPGAIWAQHPLPFTAMSVRGAIPGRRRGYGIGAVANAWWRTTPAALETPRVDTLDSLVRACGDVLEAVPLAGVGVDPTVINQLLQLSPAERIELSNQEAETLSAFDQAVGRGSE